MDCSLPGFFLSKRFSRQEYWSGLPFPSLGDLPDPGIEPMSPALAGGFFTSKPPGKPLNIHTHTHSTSVVLYPAVYILKAIVSSIRGLVLVFSVFLFIPLSSGDEKSSSLYHYYFLKLFIIIGG